MRRRRLPGDQCSATCGNPAAVAHHAHDTHYRIVPEKSPAATRVERSQPRRGRLEKAWARQAQQQRPATHTPDTSDKAMAKHARSGGWYCWWRIFQVVILCRFAAVTNLPGDPGWGFGWIFRKHGVCLVGEAWLAVASIGQHRVRVEFFPTAGKRVSTCYPKRVPRFPPPTPTAIQRCVP